MPDTGAPWNIPYAAPADLVRDWPDLSEDVADAVAAGLTAAANPGIGSNVVQTVKTDTFTTTSQTFTVVTGVTATITPSSDTAKVLVIAQFTYGIITNFSTAHFRLAGGNAANYVGNADGSRVQASMSNRNNGDAFLSSALSATLVFIDSPATTSATTYSLETRTGSATPGTVTINRSGEDGNDTRYGRTASSITAIEVAP